MIGLYKPNNFLLLGEYKDAIIRKKGTVDSTLQTMYYVDVLWRLSRNVSPCNHNINPQLNILHLKYDSWDGDEICVFIRLQ